MKWIGTVLLLGAIGCGGGGDPTPADRLQGNWLFADADGLTGVGLTFDGSDYVAFLMGLTSTNTANAEVERGGFDASTTQITFTPREWSCPGPDAIYALSYRFVAD